MVSKVDNKILEILQGDVRTPVSKIAKEVGLSENGVRYRLEKLEKWYMPLPSRGRLN